MPSAAPDNTLTSDFAAQTGPGWIGGDATYSTALPNGQVAFDFSDTLVGTAQPNGAGSLTGIPNNSELVGTPPNLFTDIGGTYNSPQSLIPDSGSDSWQVAATYVENGSQLIFVNEFAPVAGSLFDTSIAVMSLASGDPTFASLTTVPTDGQTQWGISAMQDGSYEYIYGLDFNFATNTYAGMKLARVSIGETLDTAAWNYWNGSSWVAGEANAKPFFAAEVLTGVIPLENGSGFMAVSIPGGVINDRTVDLFFSCSPQGPWSSPHPVFNIPQVSSFPDEMAYMPTFHPELSGSGNLVMSYNINSTDSVSVLQQNVHAYQPQFLVVSG
jgi:hypothetical protein